MTRIRAIKALTLLLVIAFASFSAPASDSGKEMKIEVLNACQNQEVTLRVLDSSDNPIKGAEIQISYKMRAMIYGETNGSGIFKFTTERRGIHDLLVTRSGYADTSKAINISAQCVSVTTTVETVQTTAKQITTKYATTTIKATTSTVPQTTTSTIRGCSRDQVCDVGENYATCPDDCPSGSSDGFCDTLPDGICDTDCYRKDDPDCICNDDGKCDTGIETSQNCPNDCKSGTAEDEYCDGAADGICDEDCVEEGSDPDCKKLNLQDLLLPLTVIVALFGIIAVFGIAKEFKKRTAEESDDALIEQLKERLRAGEDPAALKKELMIKRKDASLLDKAEKGLWV